MMAPHVDASRALRHAAGSVPIVLMNPEVLLPGSDTVRIDNAQGAWSVVRHLIGLGHRRIAIVTGPSHNIDARQRLDGYRAALREAAIEVDADLEFHGDFSERSGYEAARAMLQQRARLTAVFVANDHMAVGALGAFQEAGVRVPEDVALAGFDDIPMARYLTPPLTTVHVNVLQLGRRAVDLLLDPERAAGPADGRHEVLGTTLVVRGSCGARLRGGPGAGPFPDRDVTPTGLR